MTSLSATSHSAWRHGMAAGRTSTGPSEPGSIGAGQPELDARDPCCGPAIRPAGRSQNRQHRRRRAAPAPLPAGGERCGQGAKARQAGGKSENAALISAGPYAASTGSFHRPPPLSRRQLAIQPPSSGRAGQAAKIAGHSAATAPPGCPPPAGSDHGPAEWCGRKPRPPRGCPSTHRSEAPASPACGAMVSTRCPPRPIPAAAAQISASTVRRDRAIGPANPTYPSRIHAGHVADHCRGRASFILTGSAARGSALGARPAEGFVAAHPPRPAHRAPVGHVYGPPWPPIARPLPVRPGRAAADRPRQSIGEP